MKIEIRCPKCQVSFLAERDAIRDRLACPGCGTSIVVTRATPRAPSGAPPMHGRAEPAGSRQQAASAAVKTAQPATVAAAPPPAQEVVCPRCKLHFTPGRAALEPEGKRYKLLVVEDLAYFQEIARDALADSFEVRTAETLAEARAALAEGGVDLMILDLTLDGGDFGIQLLREMNPKPCPILIYTAQDESEIYGDSWEQLRHLGADDIVIKGMNVGESLLQKVNALLGRSSDEEDPVTNTVTSR